MHNICVFLLLFALFIFRLPKLYSGQFTQADNIKLAAKVIPKDTRKGNTELTMITFLKKNGLSSRKSGSVETRKGTTRNKVRPRRSTSMKITNDALVALANITSDACGEITGSCRLAWKHSAKWICHCDDKCLYYNDCCYDYEVEETTTEEKYRYHCFDVIRYGPSEDKPPTRPGILAIDSCPKAYDNETIVNKCQQKDLALEDSVFVLANKTLIFRNKFCAICNKVFNFELFKIHLFPKQQLFKTFSDSTGENYQSILRRIIENQTLIFEAPPTAETRSCLPDVTANNNSLCQSYLSPVVIQSMYGDIVFKNIHCLPLDADEHVCVNEHQFAFIKFPTQTEFLMSIMFSFGRSDRCIDSCDVWNDKMVETGECESFDLYSNVRDTFNLKLTTNSNVTREKMFQLGNLSPWLFTSKTTDASFLDSGMITQSDVIVRITVLNMKTSFLHEMNNFFKNLKNRTITLKLTEPETTESFIFTIRYTEELFNFTSKRLKLYFDTDGLLKRSKIRTNGVILETLTKNIMIVARYTNRAIDIKRVIYENAKEHTFETSIPDIITYFCFSTSVVALLVLIIAQRKLGLVTTVPSSNTENISLSLFSANLLFITGTEATEYYQICYLIGCCLHYLWLSVFSFMTLSIIHTSRTLSKLRALKPINRKQRAAITLMGLLLPVPFVVVSISVDQFGPSIWLAGYGINFCFPNHYPANLVFFIGPIIVAVAVNLTCLFYIIGKVCTVRYEISSIRKLSPYKEALIYLRIVAVSGAVWVVGLVASIYEEEIWLQYCFTICCGLHGFFISVANLTSNRICRRRTP